MTDKLLNATPFLLAGILLALALGQLFSAQAETRTQELRHVYTVCNESRISPTITEQACGDLLDKTHTRFTCSDRNTSPTNICTVKEL